MAIFKPGVAVSVVSGRVGGTIFSHNRGGAYMRNGAIPKTVTSPEATFVKGVLALVSRSWAGLTQAQRDAWKLWARENPITNRLGDSKIMTGHQAFVMLCTRLIQSGDSLIVVPPMAAPPDATTVTGFTVVTGATTAEIAFTPTPCGAANRLWVWACVVDSVGQEYVDNLFVLLVKSAKNAPSTLDIYTELEARFGVLQAGQVVHIKVQTFDTATGLVSGQYYTNAIAT